ncbi:hypothetical protein EVAR_12625_1 [Eumeta japonica]|uniref:Uncharacterized protein n=1 Tax=Eumeta variegata TaxID=151549 RepID=A0A4C1UEZ4_EUMVA|nr:hypothetical protein EVAR_12625_1 [Eumeta japonica]
MKSTNAAISKADQVPRRCLQKTHENEPTHREGSEKIETYQRSLWPDNRIPRKSRSGNEFSHNTCLNCATSRLRSGTTTVKHLLEEDLNKKMLGNITQLGLKDHELSEMPIWRMENSTHSKPTRLGKIV